MNKVRCTPAIVWLFCMLTTYASTAYGQQREPLPEGPTDVSGLPADVQNLQAAPEGGPTPAYPIETHAHPAAKMGPWLGTISPLHWGNFGITSLTADQVNDNFRPANGLPQDVLHISVFRSTIAFDKFFGNQELALELDPQAAILNGQFRANKGWNNRLALGVTLQITPRLSLTLKDGFLQVDSQQLFPTEVLGVDAQAGNVIQNNFLQVAGSYISNASTAAFTYAITPRLNLVIAPSYTYAHTTSDQIVYTAIGHTIEAQTALTYRLTPNQNLGLLYTGELLRATNVPLAANTYFNVPELFYSYQFTKTLWTQAKVGLDMANYPGGQPSQQVIAGGFTLVKTFSASALAITYGRGRTQQNFITALSGDRADLTYSFRFLTRFIWDNGAGYYKEIGANGQKGGYAASRLQFALSKMFAINGTYSYVTQRSDTPQLLSGDRNMLAFGISWQPAIPGMH